MRAVEEAITVVPASEASWEDIQTVLAKSDAAKCQCQRFKLGRWEWTEPTVEERARELMEQTGCDEPDAMTTCGLVAYLGDEPVGWCAVEPRSNYVALLTSRSPVAWTGRSEDKHDDTVWAVTCLVTRKGYRRRGVSAALIAATVEYARTRGARALEGYPMATEPGKEIIWDELFVGSRNSFVDAGFLEVSHPTKRRYVMRIEF